MLDLALCVGRFQPPHRAHLEAIRTALRQAERVAVVLGSAQRPRTPKNPWTPAERQAMIAACLTLAELDRVTFLAIPDRLYDDALWAASLRREVQALVPDGGRVGLVGHLKDHSSYYLGLFPEWAFIEAKPHPGLHATDLRKQYFDGATALSDELPEPVKAWLEAWSHTTEYARVAEEHRFIQTYKAQWAVAPYAVNFVTADALVLKSGHVLLIERKQDPGQGLWAIPGGFVNTDEPVLQAALRELEEETALDVPEFEILAALSEREVFDDPDRSQRGRTITHLSCFRLGPGPLPKVKPQDDAARAFWLPLSEVHSHGERFFDDHQDIIIHLTQRA